MDKALNNSGRNARNSKIKQKMEQCMTDNGIDRAREHGGDLHGPHLIKFDNRSETIVKGFEKILLDHRPANETEIKDVLKSFRLHFSMVSYVIALARTPKDGVSENLFDELEECIDLVFKSTKRLNLSMKTPKRHLLSHLVAMTRKYKGISDYIKDWVEKMHQKQKKVDSRMKHRNYNDKATYMI